MPKTDLYLLLWALLSFWVLGQIWLVQIVVYPLFAKVGPPDYIGYHRFPNTIAGDPAGIRQLPAAGRVGLFRPGRADVDDGLQHHHGHRRSAGHRRP